MFGKNRFSDPEKRLVFGGKKSIFLVWKKHHINKKKKKKKKKKNKKSWGASPRPRQEVTSPPPPAFFVFVPIVRPPLVRSRSHCKMLGIGVFLLSIAFVTAVPMGMRAPPVPKDSVLPSESWYTQQLLDHFDANDTTTWQQRYFVEDSFWTQTGPVFLMLDGEGRGANPAWLVGDTEIMLNARKYGAMAILLEHRYLVLYKYIRIERNGSNMYNLRQLSQHNISYEMNPARNQ